MKDDEVTSSTSKRKRDRRTGTCFSLFLLSLFSKEETSLVVYSVSNTCLSSTRCSFSLPLLPNQKVELRWNRKLVWPKFLLLLNAIYISVSVNESGGWRTRRRETHNWRNEGGTVFVSLEQEGGTDTKDFKTLRKNQGSNETKRWCEWLSSQVGIESWERRDTLLHYIWAKIRYDQYFFSRLLIEWLSLKAWGFMNLCSNKKSLDHSQTVILLVFFAVT